MRPITITPHIHYMLPQKKRGKMKEEKREKKKGNKDKMQKGKEMKEIKEKHKHLQLGIKS